MTAQYDAAHIARFYDAYGEREWERLADSALDRIAADSALWEAFLRWELDFAAELGALDGGTHIIAVVRKDTTDGEGCDT